MEDSNSVTLSEECSNTCSNTSTNNSPSKEELKEKLIEHKKKIRVLQQKVRRKERRISDINNLLQDLKSKELLKDIDGTFTFPGYSYDIFITPDACHMLKLARNALSDLKVLLDENDDPVQWKYIQHFHEEQLEEGLKFGNKLANAHIAFHRHKMNVRIAAQTLSSSVADTIEYLLFSGHPKFQGAEATIRFIRIIGKLFDLLNSRSPRSSGHKSPLRIINRCIWEDTVDSSVHYLAGLKDTNGVSLLHHRRKTFVTGLILISTSTKKLANIILNQEITPFSYVLTYKYSQDHLELLNSCIRDKNGFNNNPDIRQFKSALRKILLRGSVVASKHSNCMLFEADVSSPIFSLKWTKNRSSMDEVPQLDMGDNPLFMMPPMNSENKENILGYIGGYIVKKLQNIIDCNVCNNAMFSSNKYYFNLSLVTQKDRGGGGGLVYPSTDIVKILSIAQREFLSHSLLVQIIGIRVFHPASTYV